MRDNKKGDIGGDGAAKNMMSLIQSFSVSILSATQFSLLCISRGSDNIAVSNKKNTSKRLPTNYNFEEFFNLPTWLVNTCVPMCKTECAYRCAKLICDLFTSFI